MEPFSYSLLVLITGSKACYPLFLECGATKGSSVRKSSIVIKG